MSGKMVSNESQTQKLIGLYRSSECLWNPQAPGYLSASAQEDAWRRITREMRSGLTPDQVKLQVLALRNYYDAECAAIRQSKLEGFRYEPRHTYFTDLRFLGNGLSEETEESKASFCLSQLNCILENSLIVDDYNRNKGEHPKDSETTFCQASLPDRTNDTKHDYTLYKLILEPEMPSTSLVQENAAAIGHNCERSASGKDSPRFYPTTYCVSSRKKRNPCAPPQPCPYSDSSCSSIDTRYVHASNCCSNSSVYSYECSQSCESDRNSANARLYAWPGPRLCCQPRPKYVPRHVSRYCNSADNGRRKNCCFDSWQRNNDAVRRRLKAELAAQEGCRPSSCYGRYERRRSGEDQLNSGSQSGIPRNNSYQPQPQPQTPNTNSQPDPNYMRYNQQGQDQCYCDNQTIVDPNTYYNNQQMQDPGRSNDPQGQQIYPKNTYVPVQATQGAYYQQPQPQQQQQPQQPPLQQPQQQPPQQQQYNQAPMNSPQPSSSTKPYSSYVPCPPVMDYGRSAPPEQSNGYGYVDSRSTGPGQMPLASLPPPQDVQMCQAPCAAARHPDRYAPDTMRYTEQQPVSTMGSGRQEDDMPRSFPVNKIHCLCPTQRYNPNPVRYTDDEQDTPRRRPNDSDQDVDPRLKVCRRVDNVDCVPMEDPARYRGHYDESPSRRGTRNSSPERNYEEYLVGRKQYMTERELCCPDYESCPSPRRRRRDDSDDSPPGTSNRRKHDSPSPRRMDQNIFTRRPMPDNRKKPNRKEYVECKNPDCHASKLPAKNGNREQEPIAIPHSSDESHDGPFHCQECKECPYYSQSDRNQQDRDERIAAKTRPPPRNSDYEDVRKTKNKDRRPSHREEIECDCKSECECESENERVGSPKRRNKDNKPTRQCDCTDDACPCKPKNRHDRDAEKAKRKKQVDGTCCPDTCPYFQRRRSPPLEPIGSPKKKQTKCYDDERQSKNNSRRESPERKRPRPADDIADCESPKKSRSPDQRPKKRKAPMDVCDCECYSDAISDDQDRYSRYDRYCDEKAGERSPRRTENRNESYKNNSRCQRNYPESEDDNYYDDYVTKRHKKNTKDMECSSDSDNRTIENDSRVYRRDGKESPRNCQKSKDYKESDCKRRKKKSSSPSRQTRGTDVYESECECSTKSTKQNDNIPPPKKPEHKSIGTDVYNSAYECYCSSDETKSRNDRKTHPCSPRPRCRNDQREQKKDERENARENKSDLDPRVEEATYEETTENTNTINDKSEVNEFDDCECTCMCGEKDMITPKSSTNHTEDESTCHCTGPPSFEPQLTQSSKRNPAGNGILFDDAVGIEATLTHPSDNTSNNQWQASYKFNLEFPFTEETKMEHNPTNDPLPGKKKMSRAASAGPSKNAKLSKLKAKSGSPTRNVAPPKTQTAETAKKRTTSVANGRRSAQGGAKRTPDHGSAAANSKLPNNLNTASYFICKLQDDDNCQQYLIIMPKEPFARCDTHRDNPGHGSWKQVHCQPQFSGFQSVSWFNPVSNSVFTFLPFPSMEEISETSSYAMPPGMTDTTMDIVKEYLQQTMTEGSPGPMQSIRPVIPPRAMMTTTTGSSGPKRYTTVHRPSNKANAAIPIENRTVLLTNNSFQKLSLPKGKEDVIVLLPPVPGFRPSKNSFNTDAVEVQRIRVRNSGTALNCRPPPTKTLPPKPPTKPRRTALL